MVNTAERLCIRWVSALVLLVVCGCSGSPGSSADGAVSTQDTGDSGAEVFQAPDGGREGSVVHGANVCDAPVSSSIPPTGGLLADPAGDGRAVGAACAFGSQCVSGVCSAAVDAGACGICVERRKLGQSCGGPMQGCSLSATCRDGVCVSNKKVVGEACGLEPKGGDQLDCDDELYCARTSGFAPTGTCAERPEPGAACDSDVTCAFGAGCYGGVCVTLRGSAVCDSNTCGPGMFCDRLLPAPTCTPATLLLGELCGISGPDLHHDCVTDTICASQLLPDGGGGETSVETCVPLPTEGSACIIGSCAAGLYCAVREVICPQGQVLDRRCERLRVEGETCTVGRYGRDLSGVFTSCAPDLECRMGVCRRACM